MKQMTRAQMGGSAVCSAVISKADNDKWTAEFKTKWATAEEK